MRGMPQDRAACRTEVPLPEPSHRRAEPSRLEPYPDVLLDEIANHEPGPEARYEIRESATTRLSTGQIVADGD